MQNIKQVSWFRLVVFVGISVATSLSIFFGDEQLTRGELFTTLVQAAITGFSYLQCPEATKNLINQRRKQNDDREKS